MKCKDLGIVEFEVVWGGDKLSPVQYNFVDIGEIRLKFRPEPDSDFDQVYEDGVKLARSLAAAQFKYRMEEHLNRVKEASELAESARRAKVSR